MKLTPITRRVVYLGGKFTYARLQDLSMRFAGALTRLDVKKGDRVMVYPVQLHSMAGGVFGDSKSGRGAGAPSLPFTRPMKWNTWSRIPAPKPFLCLDTNFLLCERGCGQDRPSKTLSSPTWRICCRCGNELWAFLFDKVPNGKVDKDVRVHSFKSLLKHKPLSTPVSLDPWKDLSYILYTGGTTRLPQGCFPAKPYRHDLVRERRHRRRGGRGTSRKGRMSTLPSIPSFTSWPWAFAWPSGSNKGNSVLLMQVPQVGCHHEHHRAVRARWFLGVRRCIA